MVRTKEALTDAIRSLRRNGKTVGLVPTMGALHAGHISLVDRARLHADAVVASIFVNPAQFGPNEDFSTYPRTEDEDIRKLEVAGVAIAYLPSVEEMYPAGATTKVSVGPIAQELCGAFRPGHFEGVATIVCKLFMQAMPDVAIFGEKDYQQLHVIRRFTCDLDIPVKIIGAPIMREADGLAMSSRNRYLNDKERIVAASMYRVLTQAAKALHQGQGSEEALTQAKKELLTAGFTKVDYVELRDALTLASAQSSQYLPPHPNPPLEGEGRNSLRLLAAAWLGATRLIDNIEACCS